MRILLVPILLLALTGCVVRTAANIVTLPVRAVGAGVDAVTTSQSEADERRGREMRRAEERQAREDRRREREERRARQRAEDEAEEAGDEPYAAAMR